MRITPARGAHPPPIRVMLVDDHDVVRTGLRRLLEAAGAIEVVGEAATLAFAIEEAARARPDVVVMDVRLASESGIEATRQIRARFPSTRVVMLTSFADDEALAASMEAGASGFILKEVRGGDLVESIRAVARGENLFDREAIDLAAERIRRGKRLIESKLALLSPQEERILEKLAEGKTNREIADALGLAEKTVKNYVSNLFIKLDVARRAEAAAYLARHAAPRE